MPCHQASVALFIFVTSVVYLQATENPGTVDLSHFSFYAYAGRTGLLRWTRKTDVSLVFVIINPLVAFLLQKFKDSVSSA